MPQQKPTPELLSLRDAAAILSYSVKGLRKIVDRSRACSQGSPCRGPTIKFFQAGKGGPIKFRPEWLDEFIDEHTVNGLSPTETQKTKQVRDKHVQESSGLRRELLNV